MKIKQPLPCPGCKAEGPLLHPKVRKGNKGWLYHGVASSTTHGVECHRCGLQLTLNLPDKWPKSLPKGLCGMASIRWLELRTLAEAIKRWNKLPRKS